ncbi:MAG: DUF4038 domain-containing protein [Lentisphaerae bacterium]|nr:MAG: DUF4038 domain-containing protein [Lentisphaerota bacterium]
MAHQKILNTSEAGRLKTRGRFLVRGNQPFFWLGDTAWELFHRLSRDEAFAYLKTRANQEFNVIQCVLLAELDGLRVPNVYGDLPLHDLDPERPNEAYFAWVDEVVEYAGQLGLIMALLPTWGDKVVRGMWGDGPVIFNPENARSYGLWLGRRYRHHEHVIWVLGGDRPAIHGDDDYRPIWRAMAAGLDEGEDDRRFKTYHPMGNTSSTQWLTGEPWLDMHMMQSGHGSGRDHHVWEMIMRDIEAAPAVPTLDGEPNYEDHPVAPWPQWDPANGYYTAYDVRKQCYRSVFAGGCGVTYGHHSVWQFAGDRHPGINHTRLPWQEAMVRAGAQQMRWLRRLMESRPARSRIADQALLADSFSGGTRVCATRDGDGRYAMFYLPTPAPVCVNLEHFAQSGPSEIRAWWYDPRTGTVSSIGHYPTSGQRVFAPPEEGPDWVLVLDDASLNPLPPGHAPITSLS